MFAFWRRHVHFGESVPHFAEGVPHFGGGILHFGESVPDFAKTVSLNSYVEPNISHANFTTATIIKIYFSAALNIIINYCLFREAR